MPAMPRSEGGVTRADWLAGGIGYIEVIGFPPLQIFKPALDRAMSALKGSKALIIDVRRNGGGSPEAVAYLASYLVAADRPVPINVIVSRVPKANDFTRQSYASVPTPVSFAGVPVYVLTSNLTFSGGEEFAYDVQALKLGTIVGEVTGGGANPTRPVEIGHGMVATIPFGRAENPVTKSNWEGRGVQPDESVPAKDALRVALERLGQPPATEISAASLEQVFELRSAPMAGSEAALRRLIAGLASGTPDYSAMTPEFADLTAKQLPQLKSLVSPLGEIQSIRFRGPDMIGGDEYEIAFANGLRVMGIAMTADGKIIGASAPMVPPPEM